MVGSVLRRPMQVARVEELAKRSHSEGNAECSNIDSSETTI